MREKHGKALVVIGSVVQGAWRMAFILGWTAAGMEAVGPWMSIAATITAIELWERWNPSTPAPDDLVRWCCVDCGSSRTSKRAPKSHKGCPARSHGHIRATDGRDQACMVATVRT